MKTLKTFVQLAVIIVFGFIFKCPIFFLFEFYLPINQQVFFTRKAFLYQNNILRNQMKSQLFFIFITL